MNMEGHHLHDGQDENLDAVWKGLTALGGVYFMFLIEHFLTLGKMYKDKKQKVRDSSVSLRCLGHQNGNEVVKIVTHASSPLFYKIHTCEHINSVQVLKMY